MSVYTKMYETTRKYIIHVKYDKENAVINTRREIWLESLKEDVDQKSQEI